MWKRLLVGLDGSVWSEAAAAHAFAFARCFDAEVEGVFVSDVRLGAPPLPPADLLGAPLDMPAGPFLAIADEERRRGDAVLRAFAERARAAKVRVATAAETGLPARVLLARLRSADAIFLGRQGRSADAAVGATTREVGRESVRPVFVACREAREVKRILVTYDGSAEAMRALRVACEISDRGKAPFQFLLLTVGDDPKTAAAIQDDAATFARAHGIEAERLVRSGQTSATILATVRERACDLVIAGSYHHTRLREMLLGSVTSDLLGTCEVPVLIHH